MKPKIFSIKLTQEQLFSEKFRKNLDDNYERNGYDSGLDIFMHMEDGPGLMAALDTGNPIYVSTDCSAVGEKSFFQSLQKNEDGSCTYKQQYY